MQDLTCRRGVRRPRSTGRGGGRPRAADGSRTQRIVLASLLARLEEVVPCRSWSTPCGGTSLRRAPSTRCARRSPGCAVSSATASRPRTRVTCCALPTTTWSTPCSSSGPSGGCGRTPDRRAGHCSPPSWRRGVATPSVSWLTSPPCAPRRDGWISPASTPPNWSPMPTSPLGNGRMPSPEPSRSSPPIRCASRRGRC